MNGIGSNIQLQSFNSPVRLNFNPAESSMDRGTTSAVQNNGFTSSPLNPDHSIASQGLTMKQDPLSSHDLNTQSASDNTQFPLSALGKALMGMILQCLQSLQKQISGGPQQQNSSHQDGSISPAYNPSQGGNGINNHGIEGNGQGTLIDGAASGVQGSNNAVRSFSTDDKKSQGTVLPTFGADGGPNKASGSVADTDPISSLTGFKGSSSKSSAEVTTLPAFSATSSSRAGNKISGDNTAQSMQPFTPSTIKGADPVTFSNNPTVVHKTIYVGAGQVFDGKNATFSAGKELGDGSQSETQKPLFRLGPGATLKNVKIGDDGADGIHCYGDANLDNVHWKNVGEDALTSKGQANGKQAVINITNSSAAGASDKIFQLNGATKLNIDGFKADNFGTFVRTNGGFQGNWSINLKNIEANNGKFSFVKSDCNSLDVSLDNIKLSNVAHHLKVPTSAMIEGNIS